MLKISAAVALSNAGSRIACDQLPLYVPNMNLAEIERQALALPEQDRASLATSLLQTLDSPITDVADEEVDRREAEMDSGEVKPISQEEFSRRVQQGRKR